MIKKKYYFLFLLISVSVLHAEDCEIETDPFRLTLKHIESKGIGYPIGYTTMGAFYGSTEAWGYPWIPFFDLRGHLFNNGRSAINAGGGVRHIASRVWGAYGFYDYRRTFHTHYNQVSFGLESLGEVMDYRLNGYNPFGKKKRMVSDFKEEVALRSFNAEAGIHVNYFKGAPLYFAGGPYYMNNAGISAWGLQLRGFLEMYKHVRLEANVSYDHLFKWIGQGQLGIFFLFGGKKETRQKKNRSCETMNVLQQRALQRIDRNEIIPLYRKKGIL